MRMRVRLFYLRPLHHLFEGTCSLISWKTVSASSSVSLLSGGLAHFYFFRVRQHPHFITIFDLRDWICNYFQKRRVLKVAYFCLRMWIIDPAFLFDIFIDHFAARKGKMLRRVQVCPLDMLKSVFWFDQPESMRTNSLY